MDNGALFRAFLIGSMVQYKVLLLMSNKVINNFEVHMDFLSEWDVSEDWVIDEAISISEQYKKIRAFISKHEDLEEAMIDKCIKMMIGDKDHHEVLVMFKIFCDQANLLLDDDMGVGAYYEGREINIAMIENIVDELNTVFDLHMDMLVHSNN